MSLEQCEECRLVLVRAVYDPAIGEDDGWGCQLDESFSVQTRDVECPFFVGWGQTLPPPARSCKKSRGSIDGCSTGSGGSCGSCGSSGGCGSGGCGMGDPSESLDVKWDPEEVPADGWTADDLAAGSRAADHGEHGHEHRHEDGDHAHGEPDHGSASHETSPEPAVSCATACGALKALDRLGLGRDEDAPVPVPLED